MYYKHWWNNNRWCLSLDLVMPMYNLIEYTWNYSEIKASLWFYSKDEAINFNIDFANNNRFRSFKYKAKLLETTFAQVIPNEPNGILKNSTIAVSLEYSSNLTRSLEMSLINCKVELSKLTWTKYCVVWSW